MGWHPRHQLRRDYVATSSCGTAVTVAQCLCTSRKVMARLFVDQRAALGLPVKRPSMPIFMLAVR